MVNILISEDDDPKYIQIREHLESFLFSCTVQVKRSANTTLEALRENAPDLLILDMSLPTYEIAPGEQGGRPQDFGGLAVMDFMEFEELKVPVIIVTQYGAFARGSGDNMTLEELAEKASFDHPDLFAGLVYYNLVMNDWKSDLRDKVCKVLERIDKQ